MKLIDFPIHDAHLPFQNYIEGCRHIIEEGRLDIQQNPAQAPMIVEANCPFELKPEDAPTGKKYRYGVLLIHGLFDSPFSLKDIGLALRKHGIFSQALLLPGHGTHPRDLISVSYQQWIKAMRYGLASLRKQAEKIYLIGYSTGASLSVYQALQDPDIAGVILLSPAIKIKIPINLVVGWQYFSKWLGRDKQWAVQEEEIDYVKYSSIPFNPIYQVEALTHVVRDLYSRTIFRTPVFMAVSREDETISSDRAIQFFSNLPNPKSKMLLYTAYERTYPDKRILTCSMTSFNKSIRHLSHISLPFTSENPHYGICGDFPFASRLNQSKMVYGAYNLVEISAFEMLYKVGLSNQKRRILTYNPDFPNMMQQIIKFILQDT